MTNEIESLIKSIVPNAHIQVRERDSIFSRKYIAITIAASNYQINNVSGQFPACVSLSLNPEKMDLCVQIFGGMGGQYIYREPNKEDQKESYLAMVGIKIPFRKPKAQKENVMKAIAKFVENWKMAIIENMDNLTNKEYVDYVKAIS